MKTVYGTPWIEVEFGQRDEGWCLFTDREKCIEASRKASKDGTYDGGYIGPERPVRVYEIPYESLEADLKANLDKDGSSWTPNSWNPKFKDAGLVI